ncbi:MAG: hypothetical protein RR719_08895 [Akkermansia sp.]
MKPYNQKFKDTDYPLRLQRENKIGHYAPYVSPKASPKKKNPIAKALMSLIAFILIKFNH